MEDVLGIKLKCLLLTKKYKLLIRWQKDSRLCTTVFLIIISFDHVDNLDICMSNITVGFTGLNLRTKPCNIEHMPYGLHVWCFSVRFGVWQSVVCFFSQHAFWVLPFESDSLGIRWYRQSSHLLNEKMKKRHWIKVTPFYTCWFYENIFDLVWSSGFCMYNRNPPLANVYFISA